MTTKAIKISEDSYNWLVGVAADLQKKAGRSVSIDEALKYVKKTKKEGNSNLLLKLAGSWKMNDIEADNFMKDIRKKWEKWRI